MISENWGLYPLRGRDINLPPPKHTVLSVGTLIHLSLSLSTNDFQIPSLKQHHRSCLGPWTQGWWPELGASISSTVALQCIIHCTPLPSPSPSPWLSEVPSLKLMTRPQIRSQLKLCHPRTALKRVLIVLWKRCHSNNYPPERKLESKAKDSHSIILYIVREAIADTSYAYPNSHRAHDSMSSVRAGRIMEHNRSKSERPKSHLFAFRSSLWRWGISP